MSADKQTHNRKPRKPRSDFQRLSSRFMSGLLRSLFFINRPTRARQAGFVLPTTALLLLILTLTVGTLSYRTFSRTESVIAQRTQQVIDSAAAPTIDRAKAKLEYLFSKDERFPGGVPSSDVLASMLRNDGTNGIPQIASNPYVFPGETRIDINDDGADDNAWVFPSDIDGDGRVESDELVAYSILMDDEATVPGSGTLVSVTDQQNDDKADALVTRNGPINTTATNSGCSSSRAPEAGWQVVDAATLQKNFQVTAFVANRDNAVNSTASAIEFQQVRQANRGNKWGAWFKYDLELFPGANVDFFWNGAMHTEGNLLVRDDFIARMISSHNSCLYTRDASEITLASDGSYRGEVLSAKVSSNAFFDDATSASTFHLFTSNNQPPDTTTGVLEADNDSVTADDADLRNILLDPIKLFTEDKLSHRSDDGWSHDSTTWDGGDFVNAERIYNSPATTPYLDDTFRADNRYGPKPVYDDGNSLPASTSIGTTITSNTALTALDPTNGIYGLDGYWERRAIGQGLRIIVGQRLELGDNTGWERTQEPTEWPMYPPDTSTSAIVRQRRSLHDNLAAVQGMVVYHHESNGGTLPAACIASTAHPGTQSSIIDSRTFNTVDINGTATLNTDFFNGVGTNGWEFAFPYTTDADFAAAIAANQPLGKVLRNLGTFAGDPLGGAPSFLPTQDNNVHPAPYMAAWGDFSNLRRIFASGTAYANLSPADQSTLHSAACTVGMLSFGLNNEIQSTQVTLTSLNSLGVQIEQLIDGVGSGGAGDLDTYIGQNLGNRNNIPAALRGEPIITSGAVSTSAWNDTVDNSVGGPNARAGCTADDFGGTNKYDRVCDAADYYLQFSKEDFYRVLLTQNSLGSTLIDRYLQAAASLATGSQFSRDRALGFREGSVPTQPLTSDTLPWDTDTGIVDTAVNGAQLITGCDPDLFSESTNANIGLALAFCVDVEKKVKYPALYYLFPYFSHDHDGKDDSGTTGIYINHTQPPTEEYIADTYITTQNTNGTESNYYAVPNSDILALGTAFAPRATDFSDWVLPLPTNAANALTNPDTQPFTINFGTSGHDVAFLDKGMYDGRELMGLRMLDLDIEKLTTDTNGTDHWIADVDGIVYAFREDAVREDSIVRPKEGSTTWAACDTWDEVYADSESPATSNANCRLRLLTAAAAEPFLQDPPLMTDTNISTKPVDFYPDPDRRPYGFRLVNGSTLNRASTVVSGMTFVSDNMVYIKGDFNLHTSDDFDTTATNACTNFIEEFVQRIVNNDCSNSSTTFYGGRTTSNDNFANPAASPLTDSDRWRPVEIVGDAVGVLSDSFRDGNVDDMFTLARASANNSGNGTSSYQNQIRLWSNGSRTPEAFAVDRNGTVINLLSRPAGAPEPIPAAVPETSFMQFNDTYTQYISKRTGDLQTASPTIANAVFISGIVPSQAGQSYGGMHNFPRFLEYWAGQRLNISGGFFQLNFSTSATGPYDPDAWEPGSNPIIGGNDLSLHYGAPDRIWGYDVGLQYAPAGPIARRFVTVGRPRSEFYRELPVDDPYVENLRCATFNGSQLDSTATCP